MFDNIGGKIKTLALVCTVIGMIASVLWGLILLSERMVLLGVFVAGLGCLASWISSFLLYGFGELIEQQTINAAYSARIATLLSAQPGTAKTASGQNAGGAGYSLSAMANQRSQATAHGNGGWVCKSCNTPNDAFALYCKNCGHFK